MVQHIHSGAEKSSLYHGIATFFMIMCVRVGIELWTISFVPHDADFYFFGFFHTALFFYIISVCCIFLLVYIAQMSLVRAYTFFLYGFILVIFPPIIDYIISIGFLNGISLHSYYLFDGINGLGHSFVTFFGNRPQDGITYGTRIIIAIIIIAMSALTYINTRKILRVILMMLSTYIIFFFFSALPSLLTIMFADAHFAITSASVAGFIASPTNILNNPITNPLNAILVKMTLVYSIFATFLTAAIFYRIKKDIFIAFLKNIRPIQSLFHIGLVGIGIGLALIFGDGVFMPNPFSLLAIGILTVAVVIAWYSTVIFNDIVDIEIDKISNPTRPLVTRIISARVYNHIGIALGIISVIMVAFVSYHAAILIIFYHALSYLYSMPPLRLKRFPLIATLVAAIALFGIVIMAYSIVAREHSLHNFPVHIGLLLIVAYTISLPIKDIKDIAGDKKNHIYTLPVIFGEKVGRLLIASGIFISFGLSVFAFNDLAMLWPALLAGALCFWTLVGVRDKKFIFNAHNSVATVFVIVALYGVILAVSLFS